MKKVDFERQLSVSMEDGGIRVIPLVSESVRVLAIDYRILSDRRVLTFSLHGVWKCLRTPQPFGAWSKAVLERMTEGVEFWPSADGSDVYVDVALGRVVVAGLKAKHLSRISAALDAAAARAEADRTGGFAEMAPDVSDLFAGDPQPIGFAGLLNVEERDFGGLAVGVVNARELYILLSSKRFFTTWIEGHIRRLNLRVNVDYLKDNFKDANHSRVVRQYFLTEHAARGICLIYDSPASEAVRSYLGIVPAAADDAKKSVRRSKGSKRNARQCVDVASTAEQPELPEMTSTADQPELPEMTSPGVDASQSVGGSAVGNAGTCLSVVTGAASPTIVGLPIYSFEFRGRLVRVVLKGTSPWFVGVDVCLAIGIARLNTAVRPLPLAYMCVETIRGSRGIQRFMLLSEAGVLEIASRSVKPAAQAFAHWIRSTSFVAQAVAESADAAADASAVSADSNDGGHSDGLLADAEDGRDGLADQSLPEEASNEVAFGGTRFVPIAGGFAGILPYSERDVGGTITNVVSARDLHELLRVADAFPTWIERAIARLGLERDIDYVRDTFKGTGSCRRVRQYFLTERAARVIVFAVNPPVGVAVRNHLRAVLSAERGEVEKSGSDQVASGGVSAAQDVVESGLVSGSEVEVAVEVVLEPGESESSRVSGNELPEEKAIDGFEH